jgi:hypothetical protein
MNSKLLVSLGLLVILVVISWPVAAEEQPMVKSTDLVLRANDFAGGTSHGIQLSPGGLTLDADAYTGTYLSPVIDVPLPFNAIVTHWIADLPDSSNLTIQLRTGTDKGWWSEWFQIGEDHDLGLPEDEFVIGQMITVPAVDVTHQRIQFSVSLGRYENSSLPVLEEVRFTLIDSSAGPTAEEMVARQQELDSLSPQSVDSGYPKPSVVSRTVWCTDPRCNYSNGLAYVPVTHMIVHHTVSSNSSSNWAATVRAIWNYHYSRGCPSSCWGDIGYNYLVDMNGVIYEGHNGGDDVVGTHSGDANAGSMALSFIGTFTASNYPNLPGIAPPPAMKNSAAELFSWKADQKGIDVFGAGSLPNMNWGLPHVMGHRDVYGGTNTECPGDQAHAILPWLRNEVARRIGFAPPHIYVDELSSAFTMSNQGNWWTAKKGCGYNGHAYYTWSTTNPDHSTNWGEWRPNLPASDHYEVEVYAPYCDTDRGETYGATYTINHANGSSKVSVNHQENIGHWMSLGTYYFNSGTGGMIRLTDVTSTDSGRGVWFDHIRLRPSNALPDPSALIQEPVSQAWLTDRSVAFNWTVENQAAVQETILQVATDSQFNSLLLNKSLAAEATSYNHNFSNDYGKLFWRVILKSTQGKTIYSNVNQFGIDTEPPSSQVVFIALMEDGDYVVRWEGNDSTSGIENYDVDYREEGGQWVAWLNDVGYNNAKFVKPNNLLEYEFRSRAIDQVGHQEASHTTADMNTRDAIQVYRVIMFPLISR